MHRAEKSSSKICRSREVEKAQEIHRKKVDGVKSYLCGIISKPSGARSGASFRRKQLGSSFGGFSTASCAHAEAPNSSNASTPLVTTPSAVSSASSSLQFANSDDALKPHKSALLYDEDDELDDKQLAEAMDEFQRSLAKMEEFRAVAPVPGLGGVATSKRLTGKIPPPPSGKKKKTLHGAFRARRLKEIEANNVEVFQRIKKSAAHYRTDDLRRDWRQNVSYLSAIGDFPVTKESLAVATSPQKQGYTKSSGRSLFGTSPRRSRTSFLRTPSRAEPLPSIQRPVVAHPIKFVPNSPKKAPLNMCPAFRSLRKAMPQQPTLPPLSSPNSQLHSYDDGDPIEPHSRVSDADSKTSPSPRTQLTRQHISASRRSLTDDKVGRSLPSRSSSTTATTPFIGDLQGTQGEAEVSGDAKYQLLKTGRFVGGTYLVLTVFCGDGVTNPYGFDVFAFHRELQCEYKLSITKEMTHELLDKSSSSSLAAATAAAAGTNLSMQEIARSICDHVNFAELGPGQGEMIFLVSTLGSTNDHALLVDTAPSLMAFCVHQSVEIGVPVGEQKEANGSTPLRGGASLKRRAHVFASTCPPKSCPANMQSGHTSIKISEAMGTGSFAICFQLLDELPEPRATATSSLSVVASTAPLEVEVDVDELYATVGCNSRRGQARTMSVDRVVVAAIRHLHVISVPGGESASQLRSELIVNTHVNTQFQPCASCPTDSTTMLERKRSRRQLHRSSSLLFTDPVHPAVVLQSGLVWKNAYLLTQVSLSDVEAPAADRSSGDGPQRKTDEDTPWKWRGWWVQGVKSSLVVSVFNPNSGQSSSRVLSPETMDMFWRKLEVVPANPRRGINSVFEPILFARNLLARLQLDVDLFGQEVIIFPALEQVKTTATAVEETASGDEGVFGSSEHQRHFEQQRDEDAAVLLQARVRGFLCRKANCAGYTISEGDEDNCSDVYYNEDLDEATEMRAETPLYSGGMDVEESYDSDNEEGDKLATSGLLNEPSNELEDSHGGPEEYADDIYDEDVASDLRDAQCEDSLVSVKHETSGSEATAPVQASWKQGRKVNGQFCLLQGTTVGLQTAAITVRIAALGRLEVLTPAAEQ